MSVSDVIVDALPYIDHGYDDAGVRESALAMVEEECRRYRPTKNYLDHLPPLNSNAFETKIMSVEFERIHNRQPMETLSMKRYELPPPSAGKLSEVSAWQESIENSMAQLEHQWVRAMNLELMLDYGIESWKAYLEVFVALQAKAQTHLQHLKKQIQDTNWLRKQAQTNAGDKLRNLEANWVLLVSKNYEIEQKCAELEDQIQTMRVRLKELEDQQVASEDEVEGEENDTDAHTQYAEAENNEDENNAAEHFENGYAAEEQNTMDDQNEQDELGTVEYEVVDDEDEEIEYDVYEVDEEEEEDAEELPTYIVHVNSNSVDSPQSVEDDIEDIVMERPQSGNNTASSNSDDSLYSK